MDLSGAIRGEAGRASAWRGDLRQSRAGIRSAQRSGDSLGVGTNAGTVNGWLACWVPPRTIFAVRVPSTRLTAVRTKI
jgi:hypothetical protein